MPAVGADSWIQFEYPAPQYYSCDHLRDQGSRASSTALASAVHREKTLEASDDGQNFRKVASLSGGTVAEHTDLI